MDKRGQLQKKYWLFYKTTLDLKRTYKIIGLNPKVYKMSIIAKCVQISQIFKFFKKLVANLQQDV